MGTVIFILGEKMSKDFDVTQDFIKAINETAQQEQPKIERMIQELKQVKAKELAKQMLPVKIATKMILGILAEVSIDDSAGLTIEELLILYGNECKQAIQQTNKINNQFGCMNKQFGGPTREPLEIGVYHDELIRDENELRLIVATLVNSGFIRKQRNVVRGKENATIIETRYIYANIQN